MQIRVIMVLAQSVSQKNDGGFPRMKKFLALILACLMLCTMCLAACKPSGGQTTDTDKPAVTYKVAMVTDYGDITDQSFNQTTYEACKAYCSEVRE